MDFRRWVTIDTADCDKVNWRDPYMITKNARTAQKSLDGTKTLVSYNELEPNSLKSIASKSAEMDRSAVEALFASTEWYVEVEV
jgi:hypothetical protein